MIDVVESVTLVVVGSQRIVNVLSHCSSVENDWQSRESCTSVCRVDYRVIERIFFDFRRTNQLFFIGFEPTRKPRLVLLRGQTRRYLR